MFASLSMLTIVAFLYSGGSPDNKTEMCCPTVHQKPAVGAAVVGDAVVGVLVLGALVVGD